jgi:hypothetical protein
MIISRRNILIGIALVLAVTSPIVAQTDNDKVETLEGRVDGFQDRITTLEGTVDKLGRLKVSGYIQPQWVWNDVDSLGNQSTTRNYFTIRRGRIKFQHSTGSVTYVLYPDITERGVEMKEVWASWAPVDFFSLALGAMNRPFGYEIGYSSSSREVAERSHAENRLFAGERDLGLQFTVRPKLGNGFTPLLEMGLFNGSDNFGQGPVSAMPGSTRLGFSYNQIIGSRSAIRAAGADSALIEMINANLGQDSALVAGGGFKVNQKEFIGHVRLPFLLSDEFSFDLGGSWSLGGIAEPTDLIGTYSGTEGALQLESTGTQASSTTRVSSGSTRSGIFFTNRTIFGVDAQIYLSLLPIGGTIVKAELYAGQQPFYGSSALFTRADTVLGAPRPSTILKDVLGYYAMIVQNITDDFQLAVRYDVFDPNRGVEGSSFVRQATDTTVSTMRGVVASTGFGGDLQLSTLSVALNAFVEGNLRFTINYDHPVTETFTRRIIAKDRTQYAQVVGDPADDRFTFRMQYKF